MASRRVLLALLVLALVLTSAAAKKRGKKGKGDKPKKGKVQLATECDDGMGGDTGAGLALASKGDAKWVAPYVEQIASDQDILDEALSWPPGKREVSGCELESFKYKKLCVPADGQPGNFRVKIKVKTSCGDMIIKYRVAIAGKSADVDLWGRSAS